MKIGNNLTNNIIIFINSNFFKKFNYMGNYSVEIRLYREFTNLYQIYQKSDVKYSKIINDENR